ncbi:PLP-dependent aminotransferase family protein [Bacillus horti]|uniref:DNA-binding transcriptional MocR family regulator n=1 Tax=Caldalkalibacillus horti TaxID=77523 RepID=A0ABT9VV53_9BACI|nr:PLP-dependent aminotransferase family protein [Bacillus horti]MDQ0164871.1 DNA-binding transcriptional MocR family regulator [Bacillus horti]
MRKYVSILNILQQQIKERHYLPGQKLPSIRQAAKQYACSQSTVIRAYLELEKEHFIYSVPQSGFYVVGESSLERSQSNGEERIDFASVGPDAHLFPYLDFQHCTNKAIDTYKYKLFSYGNHQELENLRKTLVWHLANDQIFPKQEQIVITAGVQPAMELLAKIPFPNGHSEILVEQPSYGIYLRYLEEEGIPVRSIPRTMEGIDLVELERIFKNGSIKFFYTMPRHHNPLGTTYGVNERKKISQLASKYNVYIVEDDYMADLGGERKYEPIFAYNRTGHVVYLKSFSKIIFPGLKLGAVVLPELLYQTFQVHNKRNGAALLSQATLEVYIKNGMYERHKRHLYTEYSARLQTLKEALLNYNNRGLIEPYPSSPGFYMSLKLPASVNLESLQERLMARGVRVSLGKRFYLSTFLNREKFIRLSISRVSGQEISEGIRIIVQEVEELTKSS